jgi:uncharacterized protein
LFINPGEACARDEPFSSCAMLEIFDTSFSVIHYSRPIGSDRFDEHHYTFERS